MSLTPLKPSKSSKSQKKLKSHLKTLSQLPPRLNTTSSSGNLANPSLLTSSTSIKNLELQKVKSTSYLDAVNTIADFYNKEEVGRAIGMVDSVQHRQQVLDLVLKRREELKQMQDNFTWQRAAPTIRKLTTNYRNRIKQNPLSSHGLQFKKSIVSLVTEESPLEDIGSVVFLPGDNQSPMASPKYKTELSFELESKVSGLDNESPPLPRASTMNEMDVLSLFYLSKNRHLRRENQGSQSAFSLNIQEGGRTARNKNMLLGQQAQHSPQMSLGFTKKFNNIKKDAFTSYREAQETARNKEVKLRLATAHRAAKAQFVNELCNYIAKNEDNEVCQEILCNNKQAKTSLVREVDSQVKTKLQILTGHDSSLPSLRSPVESHRTPKAAVSPSLLSPKTRKMLDSSKRFELGEMKQSFPMSPGLKHYPLFNDDEVKVPEEDDSFASFTEIKLDSLYKETGKINRTMKTIQNTIENTRAPKTWKELEGVKREKLVDLYRNTGEIMKITNKKLAA